MAKTWKDQPRNVIAKDLRTPKYRKRVVPDKHKEVTEAEMLRALETTDLSDSEIEETMENWRGVLGAED